MVEKLTFEEISKKWREEFPMLKKYTPVTLRLRADYLMIGLRFECPWGREISSKYDLVFEILPLWFEDVKSLHWPLIYAVPYNDKEMSISVYFDKLHHERYFKKAVEFVKAQFGTLLQERLSVSQLFYIVNQIIKRNFLYKEHNPLTWEGVFNLKLATALYFDDSRLMDIVKEEIRRETVHFSREQVLYLYGKSVEEWTADLLDQYSDRAKFMENIRINTARPKVARLNSEQISLDKYEPDFRPWILRKLFPRR